MGSTGLPAPVPLFFSFCYSLEKQWVSDKDSNYVSNSGEQGAPHLAGDAKVAD